MALILAALLVPGVTGMWLVLAGRGLPAARAQALALVAGLATLVVAATAVVTGAEIDRPWIKAIGVNWSFANDRISAPLVLLTAAITLLVAIHARNHQPGGGSPGLYLGCILIVEMGALATFMTRDVIVFFVAFETVLIPMWLLIGRFGDPHDPGARREAAYRFVLYTALGSTTMLAGILALVGFAGTADMRLIPMAGLTATQELIVAALLVAGLGVKVPLFPVHTWLPPAHTIAPTGGSVLLAAVLLKMGTYGLIRLPVGLTPSGFSRIAPVLAVAGVVGILWGGLICLVERDLKRLIAYSSVAHMGFVALALATGTSLGVQAAMLTNVAHGVVSALLFFVVGGLKERWGVIDLADFRPALRERWPDFGFALILGLAGSLALPGLATFWGEFFTLYAAWSGPVGGGPTPLPSPVGGSLGWFAVSSDRLLLLRWCAVLAAFGAALAAAYAMRVARIVWAGDGLDAAAGDVGGATHGSVPGVAEGSVSSMSAGPVAGTASGSAGRTGDGSTPAGTALVSSVGERVALAVLCAATVVLGFVPAWVAPHLTSVLWGGS